MQKLLKDMDFDQIRQMMGSITGHAQCDEVYYWLVSTAINAKIGCKGAALQTLVFAAQSMGFTQEEIIKGVNDAGKDMEAPVAPSRHPQSFGHWGIHPGEVA